MTRLRGWSAVALLILWPLPFIGWAAIVILGGGT